MDGAGKGRPDLKLKRARQHLEQLENAIEAYRTGSNFRVEQTAKYPGALHRLHPWRWQASSLLNK
jgi:hypothetical protein